MSELTLRHRGTEISVGPGTEVTIGSDPAATLTITHPGVSRIHARVAFEGGVWRYSDAGSTNGSFMTGARVDDVVVDEPVIILLGHETDGEPIDMEPGPRRVTDSAIPSSIRRMEIALWIIAAAAVAGLVVAIVALVS